MASVKFVFIFIVRCVSLNHNAHKFIQVISLEGVQHKLKGNWMMIMNQVGASIGVICRNHQACSDIARV